jgi:sugar phosphate isomerase/epimerase
MSKVPVALQLYTVRDELSRDFLGTIRQVGQMGWAGVELAGTGGLSATELRDLLAQSGLAPVGTHISLADFENKLDSVLTYYGNVGLKYLGVPSLPRELHGPAGFRQAAARMNKVGDALRKAGFSFYYHNHAFEFASIEGERGIDILAQETDPALVSLELDVYWAQYGGQDPAAFIRAHSGRFALIHLKDMIGAGEQRTYAEIGEGVLDFAPIFAACEAQGTQWYVVEQDLCARPSLESAKLSLKNLAKWGKV